MEKETGTTPLTLQNRPVLTYRQSYFMKAYRELSRSRSRDMGVGQPVPVDKIESYCRLMRIRSQETVEDLFFFVGRLDQTFVEHIQKKMLADSKRQD